MTWKGLIGEAIVEEGQGLQGGSTLIIIKKKMAFLLCLLTLVLFHATVFAAPVSEATAWQAAKNVLQNHVALHSDWNGDQYPSPKSIEVVSYKGEPIAYLVDVYPSGHLLVAYYDDFSPVLLYSPSSTLDPSRADDPNAIESWIIPEIYNNIQHINGKVPVIDNKTGQAIHLDASNKRLTEIREKISAAWKMLDVPAESFTPATRSSAGQRVDASTQSAYASSVGPLLTTSWDQGGPGNYNLHTPAASGCNHTMVGCVATAMAQVMKYWNWPDKGVGSHSYIWKGTNLSASFAHAYDWDGMPNSLSSSSTFAQKDAVARLMSDIGVSVEMDYGCSASDVTDSHIVPSLRSYFKYKITASLVKRQDYGAADWMNLIKGELNAGVPRVITFSITDTSKQPQGHVAVIDGYHTSVSGTDQVHINYGWSGIFSGYYDITNNWAAGDQWSANNQHLGIGIEPECVYTLDSSNHSLSYSGGTDSVTVKTSPTNCSWTAVSNASWITITSGSSGTGNGTVSYSVSANTSSSPRTGTMTIGVQTFTVTQSSQ
ncbi:MAG: C10 family peptidase, partial [Nitrospirae bacterium]|nr:C10 family peptidase [Nitrospirota bacterium]